MQKLVKFRLFKYVIKKLFIVGKTNDARVSNSSKSVNVAKCLTSSKMLVKFPHGSMYHILNSMGKYPNEIRLSDNTIWEIRIP